MAKHMKSGRKPSRRCRPSTPTERLIADCGLVELAEKQLCISLVAAPEPRHSGHKIRVINSVNPEWYSRMASPHFEGSKWHGTGSLRKQVTRALERVLNGWFDPIGHEVEALPEIEDDMIDQGWVPLDEDI